MNIQQLMTITLVFSLLGVGSTGFAQKDINQDPPAEMPGTPPSSAGAPAAAPAAPVTGYQGMLPYIQENAALRKEASRKYASEKSRKKGKKSKVKSASKSKKKSRTHASVKKSGTKKKKSPSKH